jgi:hypothetical protein
VFSANLIINLKLLRAPAMSIFDTSFGMPLASQLERWQAKIG